MEYDKSSETFSAASPYHNDDDEDREAEDATMRLFISLAASRLPSKDSSTSGTRPEVGAVTFNMNFADFQDLITATSLKRQSGRSIRFEIGSTRMIASVECKTGLFCRVEAPLYDRAQDGGNTYPAFDYDRDSLRLMMKIKEASNVRFTFLPAKGLLLLNGTPAPVRVSAHGRKQTVVPSEWKASLSVKICEGEPEWCVPQEQPKGETFDPRLFGRIVDYITPFVPRNINRPSLSQMTVHGGKAFGNSDAGACMIEAAGLGNVELAVGYDDLDNFRRCLRRLSLKPASYTTDSWCIITDEAMTFGVRRPQQTMASYEAVFALESDQAFHVERTAIEDALLKVSILFEGRGAAPAVAVPLKIAASGGTIDFHATSARGAIRTRIVATRLESHTHEFYVAPGADSALTDIPSTADVLHQSSSKSDATAPSRAKDTSDCEFDVWFKLFACAISGWNEHFVALRIVPGRRLLVLIESDEVHINVALPIIPTGTRR